MRLFLYQPVIMGCSQSVEQMRKLSRVLDNFAKNYEDIIRGKDIKTILNIYKSICLIKIIRL